MACGGGRVANAGPWLWTAHCLRVLAAEDAASPPDCVPAGSQEKSDHPSQARSPPGLLCGSVPGACRFSMVLSQAPTGPGSMREQ